MTFTNPELQLIHRIVGEFCDRRIPEQFRDKVRLGYTIASQAVIVFEERRTPTSSDWMVIDIAKLQYLRQKNEWELYWQRANGQWWLYEPSTRSKTLEAMVKEIDLDADGCFFG